MPVSLTYVPLNTTNTVIQAADLNQSINVLQQPSGGQEIGHYFLEGSAGGSDTISWYIPSQSRGSTPVSVSVNANDQSQIGLSASTPSTGTLKSYGFQVYATTSGAQTNARVGGKYTIQF